VVHYFFSITGQVDSQDEEGIEFATDREARDQAIISFGEILRDLGGALEVGQPLAMEVTDAMRRRVLRLRLVSDMD
jgi:hypothetical protein